MGGCCSTSQGRQFRRRPGLQPARAYGPIAPEEGLPGPPQEGGGGGAPRAAERPEGAAPEAPAQEGLPGPPQEGSGGGVPHAPEPPESGTPETPAQDLEAPLLAESQATEQEAEATPPAETKAGFTYSELASDVDAMKMCTIAFDAAMLYLQPYGTLKTVCKLYHLSEPLYASVAAAGLFSAPLINEELTGTTSLTLKNRCKRWARLALVVEPVFLLRQAWETFTTPLTDEEGGDEKEWELEDLQRSAAKVQSLNGPHDALKSIANGQRYEGLLTAAIASLMYLLHGHEAFLESLVLTSASTACRALTYDLASEVFRSVTVKKGAEWFGEGAIPVPVVAGTLIPSSSPLITLAVCGFRAAEFVVSVGSTALFHVSIKLATKESLCIAGPAYVLAFIAACIIAMPSVNGKSIAEAISGAFSFTGPILLSWKTAFLGPAAVSYCLIRTAFTVLSAVTVAILRGRVSQQDAAKLQPCILAVLVASAICVLALAFLRTRIHGGPPQKTRRALVSAAVFTGKPLAEELRGEIRVFQAYGFRLDAEAFAGRTVVPGDTQGEEGPVRLTLNDLSTEVPSNTTHLQVRTIVGSEDQGRALGQKVKDLKGLVFSFVC